MYHDRIGTTDFRVLGPQERLMYYYSMRHPRHFCMVARISARRTARDYSSAISAIQAKHPLLRAGIRSREGVQPTFYSARPWEPEVFARSSFQHWSEVVQAELKRDFERDGPLFRATILFDESGAEIVLTFHHAIADGMAAITVVEDIAKALAGEVLQSTAVPSPIGPVDSGQYAEPAPLLTNRPALDNRKLLAIAGMPLWRDFHTDEVAVKTAALNRSIVEELRKAARENRSSVNSAVCVAAALSAAQVEHKDEIRVLSAIDLRPLLGLGRDECSMGAVAGIIGISTDHRIGFWERASLHMEKLKQLRSPENGRQLNEALDRILTPGCDPDLASGLLGGLNYDLVVSNLGDLGKDRQVGDVRLEALWGPAGQGRLLDERFLGVITFGSEMRVIEARPFHRLSILDEVILMLIDACSL